MLLVVQSYVKGQHKAAGTFKAPSIIIGCAFVSSVCFLSPLELQPRFEEQLNWNSCGRGLFVNSSKITATTLLGTNISELAYFYILGSKGLTTV